MQKVFVWYSTNVPLKFTNISFLKSQDGQYGETITICTVKIERYSPRLVIEAKAVDLDICFAAALYQ